MSAGKVLSRRSRNFGLLTKQVIWFRDNGKCTYCGGPGEVIDHVLPFKYGGPTIRTNGVLACRPCNDQKAGKMDEDLLRAGFRHLLEVGEDLGWLDGNYVNPRTGTHNADYR